VISSGGNGNLKSGDKSLPYHYCSEVVGCNQIIEIYGRDQHPSGPRHRTKDVNLSECRYFFPKARTCATSAEIWSSLSLPLKAGMYLPLPLWIESDIC